MLNRHHQIAKTRRIGVKSTGTRLNFRPQLLFGFDSLIRLLGRTDFSSLTETKLNLNFVFFKIKKQKKLKVISVSL